jgi:hypothetical protein
MITSLTYLDSCDLPIPRHLLKSLGMDYANSRITLDLYAQAGMPEKHQAQSKLSERVLRKGKALA